MSNELQKDTSPLTLMKVFDGAKTVTIEVPEEVTTRKQLESLLLQHEINFTKKDLTIQPGSIGLVSEDSQIVRPEFSVVDYNGVQRPVSVMGLFLTAKKNDSGGDNYNVRTTVSDLCKSNPDAKAYFCEGKHWTNKPTADLKALLEKWEKKHGKSTSDAPAEPKKPVGKSQPVLIPKDAPAEIDTEQDLLKEMLAVTQDFMPVLNVVVSRFNDIATTTPAVVPCHTVSFQSREKAAEMMKGLHEMLSNHIKQIEADIKECETRIIQMEAERKAKAERAEQTPKVEDMFAALDAKFKYFKR